MPGGHRGEVRVAEFAGGQPPVDFAVRRGIHDQGDTGRHRPVRLARVHVAQQDHFTVAGMYPGAGIGGRGHAGQHGGCGKGGDGGG